MTAKPPTPQGILLGDDWLTAGSPCPHGCLLDIALTGPVRQPERLTVNEDGELSCPDCWECFGIVTAGETQ